MEIIQLLAASATAFMATKAMDEEEVRFDSSSAVEFHGQWRG